MIRLATYNVEWFDYLLDDAGDLQRDAEPSGRYGASRAEQAAALGEFFKALDADAVLVVEAPGASAQRSTVAALECFSTTYRLRTRRALIGFANDTKQEIAFLFDPDKLSARHAPRASDHQVPRFDGEFEIDLNVDARMDRVRFSKPPLELEIETSCGDRFHLIGGAHLKSKAPHGAKTDADVVRIAMVNRRKQLAQALWLQARIDQHLADGTPLVVLGDLNDGPGLDSFEGLFGRSSIEIILGTGGDEKLFDPHAARALSTRFGAQPITARFWMSQEKTYFQALLDYIMLSKRLRDQALGWRIWHPLDDPEIWRDATLREALVTASDHFPVSVDLDI